MNKRGRYEAVRGKENRSKEKNSKEKNRKERKQNNLTGIFIGNAKGFGFVRPENEEEEDIFVSEENIGNAFHMDTVQVQILREGSSEHRTTGPGATADWAHGLQSPSSSPLSTWP